MRVRRAGEADLPVVRDLWTRLTEEDAHRPYPGNPFDEALVRDHVALLAEDDGTALGIVFANLSSEWFGYVFGLYVDSLARRRGVATALMKAIAEEVRAAGRAHLVLSVDVPNAAARSFYGRLGFTEVAKTLQSGTDELLERLAGAS